jgi:hypothetical protein
MIPPEPRLSGPSTASIHQPKQRRFLRENFFEIINLQDILDNYSNPDPAHSVERGTTAKRGGNGDTTSLHVIICKLLIKVAAHTSCSTGATIIGVIAFRVVQRISASAAKSSWLTSAALWVRSRFLQTTLDKRNRFGCARPQKERDSQPVTAVWSSYAAALFFCH